MNQPNMNPENPFSEAGIAAALGYGALAKAEEKNLPVVAPPEPTTNRVSHRLNNGIGEALEGDTKRHSPELLAVNPLAALIEDSDGRQSFFDRLEQESDSLQQGFYERLADTGDALAPEHKQQEPDHY